ncbi:PREDICTED: protein unc-50 homolog [Rhagoletis zephyria]|uniref:protein unc-50 homolog n=1 Tax=Rhagoletis zephyria TaxID=28612 RepID=UPI0008116C49|nr:PREDICTED: protein unc-50 homolog [Rhagoletis zephyria]
MDRSDSIITLTSESESPKYSKVNYSTKSRLNTSKDAFKKCSRYLTRLFRVNQMDFEFAFWQMVYLFLNPKKVYRNFQYRKQTKNQFARDDPAFLVLLSVWLLVSATGLSLVLHLHLLGFFKFLLWIVFIDCIFVGIIVASLFWLITNHYMKRSASVNEDVEWGFAFDIHLNAFFPPLLILHVFQLFFYNVFISHDMFLARFFGNTLWLIAVGYYCYITFLGYSTLAMLRHTQVILYPMVPLFLFYFISTLSGHNICRAIMEFYHYRVY